MPDSLTPLGAPVEPNECCIQMLATGSGFPNPRSFDDFGLRFGRPGLNGKTVSIRSSDAATFMMRVPALVATEMHKDADAGAAFTVDAQGVVNFANGGPNADRALWRAAALMSALPDTPLAVFQEKTQSMPTSSEVERLARQRVGQHIFGRR